MERLTFLDNGRPAYKLGDCVYKNEIARRLCAYEDTGLSPEEIKHMQENKEEIGDALDGVLAKLKRMIGEDGKNNGQT